MQIRGFFRSWRAAAAVVLCMATLSAAHAAAGVRELPTAPQAVSTAGTDYALHAATVGGVTVTLIDVHSAVGDWARIDAAHVPPLPGDAPVPSKDPPQWFYGNGVGWMAVPAGWRVQQASIGADGNTVYTYAAPEGVSAGWLSYAVIPACQGCLLDEAAGLLPEAGEHLASITNEAPPIRLGQTNPVMSWQSHPDECTALFRYRTGGLTVRAAVLSSVSIAAIDSGKGDLSLAQVYAALPERQAHLAEQLVGRFQQVFPACHAPNGWPGS
ncbi:DUF4850 domain-containing protein [Dyella sp. C9]|uniref:DUF4850 domain-containing protein n=1 Tax=Dyella sp. C9 TaxID=2202154 RepID=UPI000DEFBB97|nr:DUF4850 domain-containing protein [Dyella sp. C9]